MSGIFYCFPLVSLCLDLISLFTLLLGLNKNAILDGLC